MARLSNSMEAVSETLFSKPMQLSLRGFTSTTSDHVIRTISVQQKVTAGGIMCSSKNELLIQVLDEKDSFLHLSLSITEEDFHILRSQQGLLVDFNAFPHKFIELLDLCMAESSKPDPKFLLQLDQGNNSVNGNEAVLDIVEAAQFKHLVHLSLRLVQSSDAQVKAHLANCVKTLKEERDNLKQKLEKVETQMTSQCHTLQDELNKSRNHCLELQQQLKTTESNLQSQYAHDMATEKERSLKFQSDLQERLETDKRFIEERLNKSISTLEARLAGSDAQNKDLTDKKYKSDGIIKEPTARVTHLEDELISERASHQSCQREYRICSDQLKMRDKDFSEFKTTIALLEKDVGEKVSSIHNAESALRKSVEVQKKLEVEVQTLQNTITRRENSLKSMSQEMIKGNDVIRKLQSEIKEHHHKLKEKSANCMDHENAIKESSMKVYTLKDEITALQGKLQESENRCLQLQSDIDLDKTKLEEKEKIIQTNANVISWLNKQLNEAHLGNKRVNNLHSTPNQSSAPGFASSLGSTVQSQSESLPRKPLSISPMMVSIPEESKTAANKENDVPLDNKYLQPANAIPIRGLVRSDGPPQSTSVNSFRGSHISSLPTKKNNVPLASAYFPR